METSGRVATIAGLTMRAEQHATTVGKEMNTLKNQMQPQQSGMLEVRRTLDDWRTAPPMAETAGSGSTATGASGARGPWNADHIAMGRLRREFAAGGEGIGRAADSAGRVAA